MKPIIIQIHNLLLKNRLTVAVAESCTGGLLAKSLTDIPGSSSYFVLGIIAYSNQAKHLVLGIPQKTLLRYGAVSSSVATVMAQSARNIGRANYGIGVTGIAGPGGGTKEKPVGTVFIAVADKENTRCSKFSFQGSRNTIRIRAARSALIMLKKILS